MSLSLANKDAAVTSMTPWVLVVRISPNATGASLTLTTVNWKMSLTEPPSGSVAVIRSCKGPTSLFSGTPVKVFVAESKCSQAGKGVPSFSVANKVRLPLPLGSASLNMLAGSVSVNG